MIIAIIKIDSGVVNVEEFREDVNIPSGIINFCNNHSPPLNANDYTGKDASALDLDKQWAWDFNSNQFVHVKWKENLIESITDHRCYKLSNLKAEYPSASGNFFGCSDFDQNNWSKLGTLDQAGLVTYPFTIHTGDNSGNIYDLIDSADLSGLLGAVAVVVLTERATAQSYLDIIYSAVDEDAASVAIQTYLDS